MSGDPHRGGAQLEQLAPRPHHQGAHRLRRAEQGPSRRGLDGQVHRHERAHRLLSRGQEPEKEREREGGELEGEVGGERGAKAHATAPVPPAGGPPGRDWPASPSRARRSPA